MVRDALTRIGWGLVAMTVLAACQAGVGRVHGQDPGSARESRPQDTADPTAAARNRMVQRHLVERGIKNTRVLEAFRTVPRHRFLPPKTRRQAYDDESIPIGEGQTITPPYDVAFMTEVLDPKPTDKVYEVGTGSGYQSAILSRLVKEVYSVEIHAPLGERAAKVHRELGYTNIHTRVGDGYEGWPDAAPFDAIIVTCAPHRIPKPLIDQLKEGGRMVIPLGDRFTQSVHLVIKRDGKLIDKELKPTLFVPMTGKALKEGPESKAAPDAPAQEPPKGGRGRGRSAKSQSKASAKESS
jgi:protein-L-isoaspartate(D-aspartate) O-methyltransferase